VISRRSHAILPDMDSFPTELRRLRTRARLSQLGLAAEAGVSARHLACLETDKARPSRAMVLRLVQALDGPPATANARMLAAGFAPAHPQSPLGAEVLGPVRGGFERMLAAHDPFPGFLLDRAWRLVALNRAAGGLPGALGLGTGDSLLALLADPDRARAMIRNWPEVGHHLLHRLRTESRAAGGLDVLDRAAARIAADPAVAAHQRASAPPPGPVLTTRLGLGETVLAFWSMLVQAGGAVDLTIADLRRELLFPADEATRLALAGPS
jgi:transcriptional regulator with XRE-family HTH domain